VIRVVGVYSNEDGVKRLSLAVTGIAILVLAMGLAGCTGSSSLAPSTPAQVPAAPAQPVVSRLSGFVLDTGFRHLAGASVEVVEGSPQAGMSTTADANGQFSLTGTFDSTTRFRATKEGYVTATQALQGTSCNTGSCSASVE
jgi:hypothetical protein